MSAAPFIGSRDPREVYGRPGRRHLASSMADAVAVEMPKPGRRRAEVPAAPAVKSRPRAKAKAKPVAGSVGLVMTWCVVASLSGLVAYGGSALLGKSMVELERRAFATSQIRARAARADVTRLKLAYDRLTTSASFEGWAHEQGYVARHLGAPVKVEAVPEDAVALATNEPQTD